MARRPSNKAPPGARSLAEAIAFLRFAITEDGMLCDTHVALRDRFMIIRNSELAAGHPIEEDMRLAVNASNLRRAVEKVTGALTLAQDAESLTLRSAGMRVKLATVPLDEMTPVAPDPMIAPLNEHFVAAVRDCLPLIKESGTRVIDYSLLSCGQTLVACHVGKIILEIWHGNDMPPGVAFPYRFCKALVATREKLIGFGFGPTGETFTAHFENGSWIKTQLISSVWPDAQEVLNKMNISACVPLTPSFFEAVNDVAAFTDDGMIEVFQMIVRAKDANQVAEREIAPVGIDESEVLTMNANLLMLIADHVKTFDFDGNAQLHAFLGPTRRGCIVKVR